MTDHQIESLQRQIDALGTAMEKGFRELKDLVGKFSDRVNALEIREAGCQPVITARLSEVETEVSSLKERMATAEKTLEKATAALGVIKWAAVVVGGGVLIWLTNGILAGLK